MRTTLTIDPPVAERIRKRMKATDDTLKSVVNEALRAGLKALEQDAHPPQKKRFVVKAHNFGGLLPGIDPDKIWRHVQELDDMELVAKLRKS
jgi:hypothetical protein